ncbi:LysR family transcriptional regulator [Saccharomonospora sp. NPDC006951]
MLDVRRLRLLDELDRRGTINAVAVALHLAPSGVSQQLSLLEAEAGVALLERVGRNVRLTEAARVLVGHTRTVLAQLEEAEADLAGFADRPRGTVTIACFQTAAVTLLPRALRALEAHELVRVELRQAEPEVALPSLLAHDVDLVVTEDYQDRPPPAGAGSHAEPLCADPMLLARGGREAPEAGSPGSSAALAALAAARDDAWVLEPEGTAARRWAEALCAAAGFEPDVRYEASDMSVHLALARAGAATALLPSLICTDHGGANRIGAVWPIVLPGHERLISTVVREGSQTHPAIAVVREALREAAAQVS